MIAAGTVTTRALRLALGCWLFGWTLLSADVAGAGDLTRVWRQLTQAPFLLPDGEAEGALQDSSTITPGRWKEWHVAAPGIVGLELPDGRNPNEVLEAYRSNGTGLLAPVEFDHDASTGLWTLEDLPYRSRIVHVRARDDSVEALAFQLKETTDSPPIGRRLAASPENTSVHVRRHRLDFPELYVVLPAGQPVRFLPASSGAARLRLRLPFAEAPRGWQDYRLQVRADGELLQAPRLRAYQDRTQTWILDGQQTLLSRANDFFVDLPAQTSSLTLTASHRVFVQVEEVMMKPYLVPAWNHLGGTGSSPLDRARHQPGGFERALAIQQDWQASVALATDNLHLDAPLVAAGGRTLADLPSSVSHARTRERIFSRYTKLQNLLPRLDSSGAPALARNGGNPDMFAQPPGDSRFEAQRAQFHIPQLLNPEVAGEPRWTSATQRASTLNQAQAATFITLQPGASRAFPMPGFEASTRLRLITEHSQSVPATTLSLSFADAGAEPTMLLLDGSRVRADRFDPASSRVYAPGAPRIPVAATAAVEVSVPARSSEVSVSNTGDAALTVALQLRVPRKHRHDESDWIMLLSDSSHTLLGLWWQTWDSGLDVNGRWQAGAATPTSVLNGLTPVLHYLSEQAGRFGSFAPTVAAQAPVFSDPTNLHCNGGDGKVAPARWQAARRWESRKQWINANEAWLDALPGMRGAECIDAHMRFAGNLLNLGEHRLAEAYWRHLILLTGNAELRASSINALAEYYGRQGRGQARLQLRAYVALRWRDPQAMLLLAQGLFDAGQNRFGIDVAVLLPAARSSERLHSALTRLGWSTLRELIEGGVVPASEMLAHGNLQVAPLVRMPVGQMQFSDSVVIADRLLDESTARPVARPHAPLTAVIQGPVQLQVSLRPLAEPGLLPAGWVLITANDEQFPVPVSSRSSTDRYQLAARNLRVGATTQRELHLGPGAHQLRIEPVAGAVAIALLTRTPWREFTAGETAIADKRLRVLGRLQLGADADAARSIDTTPGFPPGRGVQQARRAIGLAPDDDGWQALLATQPDSAVAARELMAVLAYTAEHDESRRAAAIARGEWLAHEAADDRIVIALRNRIRQQSQWQRLELVQRSAGMQIEPVDRFSPDNEYWRVRNLFLPAWRPGEEMLSSGASLNLSLMAPAPTRLRLELTYLSLDDALPTRLAAHVVAPLKAHVVAPLKAHVVAPLKAPAGVEATIRHNGAVVPPLLMGNGQKHEVTLELERGAHDIKLMLSEFPSSSLVKVRLQQLRDGQWVAVDRSGRKRYVLAAPGKPAELEVSGPAWVRIDELTMIGTVSTYRHLARGQRLGPLSARSADASRYRVFARVLRADAGSTAVSGSQASQSAVIALTPGVEPWPAVMAGEKTPDVLLPEVMADVPVTVIGLQAPTYSASVGWFADDQAQEDVRRPVRDYVEVALARRQRNARDGVYVEANAFARDSADGEPSFGTSAYYWRRIPNTPFSLRADGRLLGQDADNGFAWATHGQLVLRHFTLGGRQRRHRSEVKLFARYLSEDQGGRDLDPDVYSPYLRDHTSGVELMHRISAQPTWDSELFGEVRVRSNELSNPTTDYLRSRLGARAQLGPLQLGSELQVTRYFDDEDRDDSNTIPHFKLLGRWYSAPLARGRIELRGELDYDMDRQRSSGWVRLLWHFDRVQGIDDFHGDRHWFDPLLIERLRGGSQP